MARNLMITALLIAMSAPAIASSYQPSAERDALTTKFIEYRCSEVQNPTQPARADNNQAVLSVPAGDDRVQVQRNVLSELSGLGERAQPAD